MKTNKGFTLIELLVVVLIIGILAAIAVPQYQKAVMKADLHKGIPLVESLYQATQTYYLAHGDFPTDIDTLDISIPINSSCTKQEGSNSRYSCDFGIVGLGDSLSNLQYINTNKNLIYVHYLKEVPAPYYQLVFEKDSKWCFAKGSKIANEVCQQLGGEAQGTIYDYTNTSYWNHYKLP